MFHRVKSDIPAAPAKAATKGKAENINTKRDGAKITATEKKTVGATKLQTQTQVIDPVIEIEDNAPQGHAPSDIQNTASAKSSQTATPKFSSQPETTIKKEAQIMNQPTQNNETQNEDTQTAGNVAGYQRAGATAAGSIGGGYPGAAAYPSYATTPSASSDVEASAADRRLTIGAGITMSGEIESCDYLLVEGTVEAALKGAKVLEIAESGVFYGTVEIEDATIAGRFEGDITAHGRLTLREGASVTGSIAYKELEIEAGAIIDGKLTPLSAVKAAAAAKPSPAAPAKEAAPKAKAAEVKAEAEPQKPANTDGGLFSKAAAVAE